MQPNGPPKRTMDGFRATRSGRPASPVQSPSSPVPRPSAKVPERSPEPEVNTPVHLEPDLRPDHDLPAPDPIPMLDAPDDLRIESEAGGLSGVKTRKVKTGGKKKWIIAGVVTIVLALIAAFAVGFVWYQSQLVAVTDDTSKRVKVTIVSGSTPSGIAEQLEKAGVIRSKVAFGIYTKLTGTENKLKAGAYSLQPSLSTPTIVDHLVTGKEDTFTVTFLPGDTLESNRAELISSGFSETDVDAALGKTYDRPLFAGKPATADLEGYLYGETLQFGVNATVEDVLDGFFSLFEQVIDENNLVAGFEKQGLTLYEGITLASIVQREINGAEDQRQVAGVFYNRMEQGMNLGSDVTYQYIADKTGVARTPTLQSPYNTRIHTGLPPGPIAVPGKTALIAVANPAQNKYLFFLSGDDDKTYFGKTEKEHQENINNHCQKKCLIL